MTKEHCTEPKTNSNLTSNKEMSKDNPLTRIKLFSQTADFLLFDSEVEAALTLSDKAYQSAVDILIDSINKKARFFERAEMIEDAITEKEQLISLSTYVKRASNDNVALWSLDIARYLFSLERYKEALGKIEYIEQLCEEVSTTLREALHLKGLIIKKQNEPKQELLYLEVDVDIDSDIDPSLN